MVKIKLADLYKEMESSPAWTDLMERLESDLQNEVNTFIDMKSGIEVEEARVKIRTKKEFLTEIKTIVANTILT